MPCGTALLGCKYLELPRSRDLPSRSGRRLLRIWCHSCVCKTSRSNPCCLDLDPRPQAAISRTRSVAVGQAREVRAGLLADRLSLPRSLHCTACFVTVSCHFTNHLPIALLAPGIPNVRAL